jgi:hypothetical protein
LRQVLGRARFAARDRDRRRLAKLNLHDGPFWLRPAWPRWRRCWFRGLELGAAWLCNTPFEVQLFLCTLRPCRSFGMSLYAHLLKRVSTAYANAPAWRGSHCFDMTTCCRRDIFPPVVLEAVRSQVGSEDNGCAPS